MNKPEGLTNRYNIWHSHNTVTFYLEDFIPDQEECRILMLKVIEQVVRDFFLLKNSEFLNDRYAWETAAGFIFDDDYRVIWGDLELSPEDLLGLVDIDIGWFRMHIKQRYNQKYGDNNGQKERRSTGTRRESERREGPTTSYRSYGKGFRKRHHSIWKRCSPRY